jgi:polyhydroxyalkanoate synthesis regulator protein
MPGQREVQPVLVRRYGRTRLYNATAQHYVTLQELRRWAARGLPFVVIDAETKSEITQVLLAGDLPTSGTTFH